MKRFFVVTAVMLASFFSVPGAVGEPKVVCEDGMCRLVEDDADSAGAATRSGPAARMALGYMEEKRFLAFLDGEDVLAGKFGFADMGVVLLLVAVFFGGLAMNLTPCVLPMIPVNLMIIGASARRGAVYGLGMALAYGTLGLAAAAGWTAFGSIQSSAWFNLAVCAVFTLLAFSLCGFFAIDFSKYRLAVSARRGLPDVYAFSMGALSAVLSGACVAPVLIALLLFTADLYSKGNAFALALPFVMGLGMASPWPLAGAGMKVLPRPGGWMKWVNRVFAAVVLLFAAWYGHLAYVGFFGSASRPESSRGAIAMSVGDFSLEGLKRPVLVDCWASWCKNCKAMDEVLARPAVAARLEKFTVVKLQAEDISKLVELPGFEAVKGLPAFVIFE